MKKSSPASNSVKSVSSFFEGEDTVEILIPSGGAESDFPATLPELGSMIRSAVTSSSASARIEVPGFYCCLSSGATVDRLAQVSTKRAAFAMAAQYLPAATFVTAESISGWTTAMLSQVTRHAVESGDGDAPRFLVHVVPYAKSREAMQRRCRLIDLEFQQLLQKKRRSLSRRLISNAESPFERPILLLQVVLLSPSQGWISVSLTAGALPSVFPLGMAPETIDKRPPSRAYLKLLEAERHLWERISEGERCVDLGGSPGGWTWVARDRKATVIAVDRSELDPKLMSDSGVEFIKGDALKYLPTNRVDWLLCDVICAPHLSLELLENWFTKQACRKFIVTLKFKGEPDWKTVLRAQQFLAETTSKGYVRRLAANKNEVTMAGVFAE